MKVVLALVIFFGFVSCKSRDASELKAEVGEEGDGVVLKLDMPKHLYEDLKIVEKDDAKVLVGRNSKAELLIRFEPANATVTITPSKSGNDEVSFARFATAFGSVLLKGEKNPGYYAIRSKYFDKSINNKKIFLGSDESRDVLSIFIDNNKAIVGLFEYNADGDRTMIAELTFSKGAVR